MRGWAGFYDQPFLSCGSFSGINFAVFLEQIKQSNVRRFWTIFVTKQGLLAFKKSQKNTVLSKMAITFI